MQLLNRPKKASSGFKRPGAQRRRFSPLMLISVAVTALIVLGAGTYFVAIPLIQSHAAAVANPNCTLTVPANPLSAAGLATPYQLSPTDINMGPCNESNVNQSAFVQGTIIDPAAGAITIYNPLVIDAGTAPAVVPTPPVLPAGAVVSLMFGFNGTLLKLQDTNGSLAQGNCVNGLSATDIFGQVSYCNTPAFFAAANTAIAAGQLTVPAVGQGLDGQRCLTLRDIGMTDMDPSDNDTTTYLTNGAQTAQATTANMAALPNATILGNGSDSALLTNFEDKALGCASFTAPDIGNNNTMETATQLSALQAAVAATAAGAKNVVPAAPAATAAAAAATNLQNAANGNAVGGQPLAAVEPLADALVPPNDEMTMAGTTPVAAGAMASPTKTNLYRAGFDQPQTAAVGDGVTYCQNLGTIGTARIQLDMAFSQNVTSPVPALGNNLFNALAGRVNGSWLALGCPALLNDNAAVTPFNVATDAAGVIVAASINNQFVVNNGNGAAAPAPANPPMTVPPVPAPIGTGNGGTTPTQPATPTPVATPAPAAPGGNGGTTPAPVTTPAPAPAGNGGTTPAPAVPAAGAQPAAPQQDSGYQYPQQTAQGAQQDVTMTPDVMQTAQNMNVSMLELVFQVYVPMN